MSCKRFKLINCSPSTCIMSCNLWLKRRFFKDEGWCVHSHLVLIFWCESVSEWVILLRSVAWDINRGYRGWESVEFWTLCVCWTSEVERGTRPCDVLPHSQNLTQRFKEVWRFNVGFDFLMCELTFSGLLQ